MASLVLLFTSFLLLTCMHYSSINARLLPTIVKPSSPKSHRSLQVAEKINGGYEIVERTRGQVGVKSPATPLSKAEFEGSLQNGSDIVESSSSHHDVALLKRKHVEDSEKPSVSGYPGKEEVNHSENDDEIVVTDYQPPHRKTPIHNK